MDKKLPQHPRKVLPRASGRRWEPGPGPCEDTRLSLQKGSPQYQLLTVPEHSPRGTLVGNVTGAVDADEGSNAIVYYFIAGGPDGTSALPAPGLETARVPCPSPCACPTFSWERREEFPSSA